MRTNLRNPDHSRIPILGGAVAQAAVFGVMYMLIPLSIPLPVYGVTLLVGGFVAGWYSERMRTEFIDGAMAGGLGVLFSYFVFVYAVWRSYSALPTDLQIDLTLVLSVYSWMALVAFMQFGGMIGAVVGQLAGKFRRLNLREIQIVWT